MRALPLIVLLTGASGCVGPPHHFSPRSAASLEAEAAPTPAIGIALREDPPLPGGDARGWAGLAPAAPTAGMGMGGMDHSHMHHGAGGGGASMEMEPGMTHGSGPANPPAGSAPTAPPPESPPAETPPGSAEGGGHSGH